jgi:hypothetical protein
MLERHSIRLEKGITGERCKRKGSRSETEPQFAGTVSLGTDFASKRIISYGLNPILLLGNPFGNVKDRMLKQHA